MVLIIILILLILSGLLLSKFGMLGALILAIGALAMFMSGGWIGGAIWLFFAWNSLDRSNK